MTAVSLAGWLLAGCGSGGGCPAPNGTLNVTISSAVCLSCGRIAVIGQSPQITAAIAAGKSPCSSQITGAPPGCVAGTIWINTYGSCGSRSCGPFAVDLTGVFSPAIAGAVPPITDTVSFCAFDYDGSRYNALGNCVSSLVNQCGATLSLGLGTGPGTSNGPPAPAGVAASPASGRVSLSWQASTGATSYTVYRGSSASVTPATGVSSGQLSTTSYVATGLTDGTTYWFVVTATGASGEGPPSAAVSATPGAGTQGGDGDLVAPQPFGNSVLFFGRTANGNVAPLRTLSGSATQLSTPRGVSLDATNGEVFIASAGAPLRVFARTASGNAAPLRTLNDQGDFVRADPAHGEVAMADAGGAIRFFSRTASGATAPLRTLQTNAAGGGYLYDFAIDAVNDEVLVLFASSTSAPVQVVAYGRTDTGAATSRRTLTAFAPQAAAYAGVAVDAANGEIWVTVSDATPGATTGTRVFARTAAGTAAPLRSTSVYAGTALFVDAPHGEVGLIAGGGTGSGRIDILSRTALTLVRSVSGAQTGLTGYGGRIDFGP